MLGRMLFAAASVLLGATASSGQQMPSGTTRTDLQRHDLSVKGWETLQARVDFEPGAKSPLHSHPGEELVYVAAGSLEYVVEGKPPVTLATGETMFIPKGVPHSARNPGTTRATELATYVLEKGKPLVTLVRPEATPE